MQSTSAQSSPAESADDGYKWKVLISVVIGLFMVILDATIVNVALRALEEKYSVPTSDVQWVISLYTLALGVATPLSGFLGTRYGVKRIFLIGIAMFTLGSTLCALSPTLGTLIASRALQGIGGGIALPLGSSMLFSAFPPHQRGIAFGVFGIVLVFAPASGPILGGWFVDMGHVPFIFGVNIPIGILGLVLGARLLRNTPGRHLPIDILGIVLAPVSFGLILYGASEAGQYGVGWGSKRVLLSLAIGLVLLCVFAFHQLHAKRPLLDVRLYRIRSFLVGDLVGMIGTLALFGAEFLLPLYLQIVRGKSALDAGLFLLPLALASGLIVPLAGKLADTLGPRVPVVIGFLILGFNTYQLSRITAATSLGYILFLTITRGIGVAFVVQNAQVAALADIPRESLNDATPLYSATGQITQSIGVAVLATILSSAVTAKFPVPGAVGKIDPTKLVTFQSQYVTGLQHAYDAALIITIAAGLLSLMLPGWPGARKQRVISDT